MDSQPPTALDVFCPQCMYNLRGIDSDRCPECGYSLAFLKIPESQIPWVHRKTIGRLRAYWQTVWWATFRRPKFGEELTRLMSLPDARRFHYVTTFHVYLALVAVTILLVFAGPPGLLAGFSNHPALAVCVTLLGHSCALLSFAVAVRAGRDSIRDKDMPASRQAQAIALNDYAAGALSWALLPWSLSFVAFRLAIANQHAWYLEYSLAAAGILLLLSPGLLWILDLNYLERRFYRRSAAEKFRAEFKQSGLLGIAVLVIMIILPMTLAYVALIFYSLV